jgi:hypothetical protein
MQGLKVQLSKQLCILQQSIASKYPLVFFKYFSNKF